MKILQALKLLCLAAAITLIGKSLRGHDVLTATALLLLTLLVTLKLFWAYRARKGGGLSGNEGGGDLGWRPVPRAPFGRPPVLRAEAEVETRRPA